MLQLSFISKLCHNIIDITNPRKTWHLLNTLFHMNTTLDIMVVCNYQEQLHINEYQEVTTFMQQISDILYFDKLVLQIQLEKSISILQEPQNRLHMKETNAIFQQTSKNYDKFLLLRFYNIYNRRLKRIPPISQQNQHNSSNMFHQHNTMSILAMSSIACYQCVKTSYTTCYCRPLYPSFIKT